MTECIKCQNLDLKADERMTKVGFSRCKKKATHEFVSIKRKIECKDYREDKPEVIEKRLAWRAQRETRKAN